MCHFFSSLLFPLMLEKERKREREREREGGKERERERETSIVFGEWIPISLYAGPFCNLLCLAEAACLVAPLVT